MALFLSLSLYRVIIDIVVCFESSLCLFVTPGSRLSGQPTRAQCFEAQEARAMATERRRGVQNDRLIFFILLPLAGLN